MNAKHTPGPWEAEAQGETIQVGADARALIACVTPGGDPDHGKPDAVTRANAARIVACVNACEGIPDPLTAIPAMREALRVAADFFRNRPGNWEGQACDVVNAALAAAEGQA